MNEAQRSWVYFVRRPDGDIKIGTIVKYFFTQRMWALWKKHGSILVLGVIEGGHQKEAELHSLFHDDRRFYFRQLKVSQSRHYTEYFAPTPELLTFIRNNSVDLAQFKPKGGNFKHDYFGWNAYRV